MGNNWNSLPSTGHTPDTSPSVGAVNNPPNDGSRRSTDKHQARLTERSSMQKSNEAAPICNQLSNLLEFSSVGYLVLDIDGLITEANSTIAELFGVDRQQLCNKLLVDAIANSSIIKTVRLDASTRPQKQCIEQESLNRVNGHSNKTDELNVIQEIRAAIRERRPCKVTLEIHHDKSTSCCGELTISPVKNELGVVTHFVGIHPQVSNRSSAEEDLKSSELRFHAFMDHGPAVCFLKDKDGKFIYFNQNFSEQFDATLDESGNKTNHDFWPKDVADRLDDSDRVVLDRHVSTRNFEVIPDTNGLERHWLSVKFPVVDADGTQGVGGIAFDMTEQRNAELERDQFFDSSTDFLCIADLQGNFKRVNKTFISVLGYTLDELLTIPFIELIHPDDRERTSNIVSRMLKGGDIVQFENRYRCKDGSYRTLSWTSPPPIPGKTIVYAVARDVTEKMDLERRLLNIADEEQQRISHDLHDGLGQELTGLTMMAESLAMDLKDISQPCAELAKKIARQIEESQNRIRSMARGLRPVEIDSHGIVSALSLLAERSSEMYGIECVFVCKKRIRFNDPKKATHLYRIAQEAINNAIRHANPNSIWISLSRSDRVLELRIIDDGSGFKNPDKFQDGIGMKSMRYRCDQIGGLLDVTQGQEGGTVVACKLFQ